jgi:arsenate reductase (glutaredoxin)
MTGQVRASLLAEFLGTLGLLTAVIGSGVMAQQLSQGNNAVALLANTLATVFALYVLIAVFAPISGAHFNPAVSLVMWLRGLLSWRMLVAYVVVQFLGAVGGAWLVHAMFDLPVLQLSSKLRDGPGQWLAEGVATAGLLLVVLRGPTNQIAVLVAAYIGAAYWFTASTSFANPAAVMGRMLSDSFAGINPSSAPGFVVAQLVGAVIGLALHRALQTQTHLKTPPLTTIPLTTPPLTTLPPSTPSLDQQPMNKVTIYHNPSCGTSRNTLAMLERAGIAPTVVLYLDTPLDVAQLRALISAMNVRVREAMRTKESLYSEQDMDGAQWTDEALLLQIAKHPILLNRPVVQSPLGVKLCRPSEAVLALLTPQQQRQLGAFTKEDGQLVPPTQ